MIENNSLEETLEDMKLILAVCSENRDLTLLLKSPVGFSDKKLSILSDVFSKSITDLTMTFINIITSKKREKFYRGNC